MVARRPSVSAIPTDRTLASQAAMTLALHPRRPAAPDRCSISRSAWWRAPSSRCRSASCGSSRSAIGRISARWWSASPCSASASSSAVMCVGKDWFARHWRGVAGTSLLAVRAAAGRRPTCSPSRCRSTPSSWSPTRTQKWRLLREFPALSPAFPGRARCSSARSSSKADKAFARVYFADLVGSGLGGLLFLGAMFLLPPENLIVAPLALWVARRRCSGSSAAGRQAPPHGRCSAWRPSSPSAAHFVLPDCARPAQARDVGLQGRRLRPEISGQPPRLSRRLALRRSRALFAAPICISRRASPTTPPSTCPRCRPTPISGMYIDGDGPIGIMRNLPRGQTAYFRFLPMVYPYVIKKDARHLRRCSSAAASRPRWRCAAAPSRVTVAEANPADPATPSATDPGAARLHRRRAARPAGPRDRLRRPALSRRHRRPLRRGRPQPCRFGRPLQSRRLRHRREIRLHATRRWRPTCAR